MIPGHRRAIDVNDMTDHREIFRVRMGINPGNPGLINK
jgi:hypothetical protein